MCPHGIHLSTAIVDPPNFDLRESLLTRQTILTTVMRRAADLLSGQAKGLSLTGRVICGRNLPLKTAPLHSSCAKAFLHLINITAVDCLKDFPSQTGYWVGHMHHTRPYIGTGIKIRECPGKAFNAARDILLGLE